MILSAGPGTGFASIPAFCGNYSYPQRKKKSKQKKKENFGRGGLWKLPQPRKFITVAFGDFFLMNSHGCLKKPAQKPLRLFHSYNTGPAAINLSIHFLDGEGGTQL